MTYRAVIQTAIEALEVGDREYACAVLVAAIEDGVDDEFECGPARLRCVCPECGLRFEWPGLLDHHQRFAHFKVPRAA